MGVIQFGSKCYPMELRYEIGEPNKEERSITITITGYKISVNSGCPALPWTQAPYKWAYGFNDGTLNGPHSAHGDVHIQTATSQTFGTQLSRKFFYNEDGTLNPEYDWGVNIDYSFRTPFPMDVVDVSHSHKKITTEIPNIEDIRVVKVTYLMASSVTNSSAQISYNFDNRADAFQYDIREYPNGYFGGWKSQGLPADPVNARSHKFSVSGLKADTQYQVKVRLKRWDSNKWSEEYTTTFTTTKPSAASSGSIILKSRTYDSITVQATDFYVNYPATISHYDFCTDGWSWVNNGMSDTYTLSGLSPNQSYPIYASVVDSYGTRSASAYNVFQTLNPSKPTLESVSVSNIQPFSVRVVPGPAYFVPGYSQLDHYQYSLNSGGWIDVGSTSFTIDGLAEQTQYDLRVRVVDDYGTASDPAYTSFTTIPNHYQVMVKKDGYYGKHKLSCFDESSVKKVKRVYRKQSSTSWKKL